MIYTEVTKHSFIDAFKLSSRKDQFSYDALGIIYDYLDELSESTSENIELDIVAICCEYAESSLSAIASDYDIDLEGLEGEDRIEAIVSYMEQNTYVLGMVDDETMVYQQF
jgi:predicted ArsR family transcriptional regulator